MNSGETQMCSLLFYKRTREKQMSKSINNAQSEMLLDKMVQRPDIARGFSKDNREKVADFWKQLTSSLNSLGPPVKSEAEWKKVWNDQKRYVRKKASKNVIYEKGTGGGPNKTKQLSTAEETIYQLLDLNDSFEGIEDSHRYGVPAKKAKPSSPIQILSNIVLCDDDVPGCSTDLLTSMPDSQPVQDPTSPDPDCDPVAAEREYQPSDSSTQPVPQSRPNPAKKMTNTELILQEIETRKDLCGKLSEILAEIKPNNDQICSRLDRMCDIKERKLVKLKEHNLKVERLRKRELEEQIEFNRRTLELKEIKIEVLKRKSKDYPTNKVNVK